MTTYLMGFTAFITISHAQERTVQDQADFTLDGIEIVTGTWPPYVDDSDLRGGLATRIVEDILLGADYQPTFRFMPFSTGLRLTREGFFQATFPYFRTADREENFLYSDPLFSISHAIFVRSDNEDILQLEDLAELSAFRAATVQGYAYGRLDAHLTNPSIYASEVAAFRALLDGEVDFLPASAFVGAQLLDTYFISEQHLITSHAKPGMQWDINVHLIAPRNWSGAERLMDRFNASLRQYTEAGGLISLQQLEREQEITRRLVRLTDPGSFSLVVARTDPDSPDSLILPRGTQALVIEWSPNFTQTERTTIHEQLQRYSQVRLLNGPMKDAIVWVQNMYIEILDQP